MLSVVPKNTLTLNHQKILVATTNPFSAFIVSSSPGPQICDRYACTGFRAMIYKWRKVGNELETRQRK
jgi:hypothetical protein